MEDLMEFERCKEEYLTKLEPEEDKINSLTRLAEVRIKAINQIQRDAETSTIVAEGYYEAIKELLTALLLKHGWKSDNHECLISFFNEHYPEYEYEISAIHQLKKIRNRINYDGVFIAPSYLEKNELEFNHIARLLNSLIQKQQP